MWHCVYLISPNTHTWDKIHHIVIQIYCWKWNQQNFTTAMQWGGSHGPVVGALVWDPSGAWFESCSTRICSKFKFQCESSWTTKTSFCVTNVQNVPYFSIRWTWPLINAMASQCTHVHLNGPAAPLFSCCKCRCSFFLNVPRALFQEFLASAAAMQNKN